MPIYARQTPRGMQYADETGKVYTPEELAQQPHFDADGDSLVGKVVGAVSNFSFSQAADDYEKSRMADLAENGLPSYYDYWNKTDADKNQEVMNGADQVGITHSVAFQSSQQGQDELANFSKIQPVDFGEIVRDTPILAQRLANTDFMARSHDDIQNLSALEKVGRDMSLSYELTKDVYRLNEIDAEAAKKGQKFEDLETDVQEERRRLKANIDTLRKALPNSLFSVSGLTQMATQIGISFANSGQDVLLGAAGGAMMGAAAGSAIPIAGTTGGAIAGYVAGAGRGLWLGMARDQARQSMGEKYRELMEKGIDTYSAQKGAAINGAANFALGLVSLDRVAPTKIVQAVEQSNLLKKMGINTVEQSFIGALTGAASVISDKSAQNQSWLDWTPQDVDTVKNGAIDGALMGTMLALPGMGWAGVRKVMLKADEAKTGKRDPDVMKQYINEIVGNDVSLNTDNLYDYIQRLPEADAKKVLDALNVDATTLKNNLLTGQDTHITAGDLAKLPEEVRQEFYPDLKVDGLPSAREMQQTFEDDQTKNSDETPDYMDELDDDPTYKDFKEAAEHPEEAPEDYTKWEEEELNRRTDEAIDEIDNDPLYKAEEELQGKGGLHFDLQMFGLRDVKKIAKDFNDGKLNEEQEAQFEALAERYGFSSGSELAKEIIKRPSKSDAIDQRMARDRESVKAENGMDEESLKVKGEVNDSSVEKVSMERAALDEVATDAATKKRAKESDTLFERVADTVATLRETWTGDDEMKALLDKIHGGIEDARKEMAYNNRWFDAEKKLAFQVEVGKARAKMQRKIDALRKKLRETKGKDREQLLKERKEAKEKLKELNNNYREMQRDLKSRARLYKNIAKDDKAKRLARVGTIGAKDAKQIARTSLGNMTVREASNYKRFAYLARKAKAMSDRLYRKAINDRVKGVDKSKRELITETTEPTDDTYLIPALRWKNREVISTAMGNEAVRVDKWLRKQEEFFKSIQRQAKKVKPGEKNAFFHTEEDFAQLGRLLGNFGIELKGYTPKPDEPTLSMFIQSLNRKTGNSQSEPKGDTPKPGEMPLSKFIQNLNNKTGNVHVADWIENEAIKKPYDELTISELDDLVKAVKNLRRAMALEDKMFTGAKQEEIADVRNTQMKEWGTGDIKKGDYPEHGQNFKSFREHVATEYQTMDTYLSRLVGENSKMYDFWVLKVFQLGDKESKMIHKIADFHKAIWDRYTSKERNDMWNKKIFIPDLGINLTKSQMLSIAMNLGTADNRAKLFSNVPIDLEGAKNWNEDTVLTMLNDNMTAKDWGTVQKTWDISAGLWPQVRDHEKRISGFAPEEVKAVPFDVKMKDGTVIHMDGGYYPLSRDLRGQLKKDQQADVDLKNPIKNSASAARIQHNFTKQRTSAEYQISLDPQLFVRNINAEVHDLVFRDWFIDATRIADDGFYDAILSREGRGGVDMFKNYLKAIAGNDFSDSGYDVTNAFFKWAKKNTARSSIMLNFGVMAQNLANVVLYPYAMKGFGTMDALKAIIKYGMGDYWMRAFWWRKGREYVRNNLSPYMQDMMERPDYSMRMFQGQGRTVPKNAIQQRVNSFDRGMDALTEFSGHLMWLTDSLISVPMWRQAFEKKLAETGDREAAQLYADTLIRRVNGSSRKYEVSEFMRKDKGLASLMNTFMGFFNTEANRWIREAHMERQRPIKNLPRFSAFVASRVIVFALASNLLMGKGPDDEKKKQSPFEWAASGALSYPFTLFPLLKDVAPMAIDFALGGDNITYRPPIQFNPLSVALNAARYTAKGDAPKALESALKLGSYAVGLPQTFNNLFWNAYDYDQNNMDDWKFADLYRRRPSKDR